MKQTNYRRSTQPRQPKAKSATQVALTELANTMRRLRMHSRPVPQQMEAQYRQLLAQNYAEMR